MHVSIKSNGNRLNLLQISIKRNGNIIFRFPCSAIICSSRWFETIFTGNSKLLVIEGSNPFPALLLAIKQQSCRCPAQVLEIAYICNSRWFETMLIANSKLFKASKLQMPSKNYGKCLYVFVIQGCWKPCSLPILSCSRPLSGNSK